MSFRFELAALRKEHEAQRVTLRKAEDELAALRKEHEAQRVALRKAEDESAQLRSENAQLRDGLDGLRRGAASSAAARPRLGGPAAAAAAVAPRKRLASAEAESKASSAPQAKRQAASAGSSTALSLIESAHLKPLGRAQPAQASSGAAPTLAAKARSAQLDAAPARQQVRPRRRDFVAIIRIVYYFEIIAHARALSVPQFRLRLLIFSEQMSEILKQQPRYQMKLRRMKFRINFRYYRGHVRFSSTFLQVTPSELAETQTT